MQSLRNFLYWFDDRRKQASQVIIERREPRRYGVKEASAKLNASIDRLIECATKKGNGSA